MDESGEPVTRHDIEDLRQDIRSLREGVVKAVKDLDVKLLKAFYLVAESNQKRFAEIENENTALRNRLATLEARLVDIEKRMNLPPLKPNDKEQVN